MRIGFISTFPPIECGIATYTQYLTDALKEKNTDVYIVSHYGSKGDKVFPSFDYEDGDLAEKAFSTMVRFTPDVVHIQHEFGLFGKNYGVNVIPLITNFRLVGIPVITTLHTLYKDFPEQHKIILENICFNSAKIIVHEDYQKEVLLRNFAFLSDEKVIIIPHGARIVKPIKNAKKKLNLPDDKKIVLLIGYFRPSKNFELIVDIFPRIVEKSPDTYLVIAGKIRGREHLEYRQFLFDKIHNSPVKENIVLVRGQLPQETFDTILSAADVVVLPYKINSQSGILAHTLAFGKPFVASDTPSMELTVKRTAAGLIARDNDSYVDHIVRILNDNKFAKKLSQNALQYVQNHISWSIIAQKHLEVYNSVFSLPEIESRIIVVD